MISYARLTTPAGELVLSGSGALDGVWFDPHRGRPLVLDAWTRDDDAFADAASQLAEWFAGTRRDFDLETNAVGTSFQRRVWDELATIPFGATVSYTQLATMVGGSARAVGNANARNPLSIIVPCHRVVGADGSLTGYAGGVDRKRWLLDFESGRH